MERPRQSLQVNKEISRIGITLANQQVLVEGDPRKDKIDYVTYPEFGPVKIEIDNEIIEGATLDLKYDIRIDNKSERDYDDIKYYRYGDSSGLEPVKIALNYIVDYVDEKLSITYDINDSSKYVYYNKSNANETRWQIQGGEPMLEANSLAGISIDPSIYNTIKNRKNIAVKNLQNKEIAPNQYTKINLVAKKLLTDLNNNDQVFDNYIELLEVTNSVGRFYGEMVENEGWKLATPGNFDIGKVSNKEEAKDECDNSNYSRYDKYKNDTKIPNPTLSPDPDPEPDPKPGEPFTPRDAKLVIIPPTGEENVMVYVIVGIGSLVVLLGGIILIKKKILD